MGPVPLDDETARFYATHAADHARRWTDRTPAGGFSTRHAHLRHAGRLLDLGCGGGLDLAVFVEGGWDAVGCDISAAMASVARASTTAGAQVVVADACALPFAAESFAAVWSSAGLVHIDDTGMRLALVELQRICRDDSVGELTVKHRGGGIAAGGRGRDAEGRWFRMWRPDELAAAADAAGLIGTVTVEDDSARPDTSWCRLRWHRVARRSP